jgi:hypothetical protein
VMRTPVALPPFSNGERRMAPFNKFDNIERAFTIIGAVGVAMLFAAIAYAFAIVW